MGAEPFRVHRTLHPDHLWIWRPAVYIDENQRSWMPLIIEVGPLRSAGVPFPGCQRRGRPGPGGAPGCRRACGAGAPGAHPRGAGRAGGPRSRAGGDELPWGGAWAKGWGPRATAVRKYDLEPNRNFLGVIKQGSQPSKAAVPSRRAAAHCLPPELLKPAVPGCSVGDTDPFFP